MKIVNNVLFPSRRGHVKSRPATVAALVSVSLVACGSVNAQTPLGTQFTYQGQLKLNCIPLSGTTDVEVSLWTAAIGGMQVEATLTLSQVEVTNGSFTINLDFGANAFDGDKRWLELYVRKGSNLLEKIFCKKV